MSNATFPISSISVPKDRQRKKITNTKDLADSILRIGLINPIVITKQGTLVAGERRLTAWKELQENDAILGGTAYDEIPVSFVEDLPPEDLSLIELDENIRREDITWQERAEAVAKIHSILQGKQEGWTTEQTAQHLGVDPSTIYKNLMVSTSEDDKIKKAPTMTAALNVARRAKERKMADTLSIVQEALEETLQEQGFTSAPVEKSKYIIQQGDAISFFKEYNGPLFTLLHCDFPYGIGFQRGWDNSTEHWGGYDDNPEVYWALLNALASNWEHIMAPSSHLVFWFSMKYYSETMSFFSSRIPQLTIDPFPFIWGKSDNKGSLPDPNRGMRRIYETALFGRTGDRPVIQAVSNACWIPTHKNQAIHISEKPEEVLLSIFKMLVDENTKLLDPTCGGGSAIRAAKTLNARSALGLELDPEYVSAAQSKLILSPQASPAESPPAESP